MTKKIILALLFFSSTIQFSFSQLIEVLKTNERKDLPVAQDFAFIEKKTDPASYNFVSTAIGACRNKFHHYIAIVLRLSA